MEQVTLTNAAGHTLTVVEHAAGFDVLFADNVAPAVTVPFRATVVAPPPPPPAPRTVYTSLVTATPGARYENCDFKAGLRVVADDVDLVNCTVENPGNGNPALYLRGDRINVFGVLVTNCSEGVRLEGGDKIGLTGVRVQGMKLLSESAHSDALQVFLQEPLTNLLIDACTFDGHVAGDADQSTANGSQLDGRGAGGRQFGITGTIRDTVFKGGRYYSCRYYNIGGPLILERVTHEKPYTTNSASALMFR